MMTNALNFIKDVLYVANNYWTLVVVIIGLFIALYEKVKTYMKTSKEEKINMAKKALKENLLKYMSDAEIEWSIYEKSGEIKRSQVITKIYEEYPILKECINQEELINYIDTEIKKLKVTVDKVITDSLK